MIEVIIKNDGRQLGKITMENVTPEDDAKFADYSIRFGVDKHHATGIHQRAIYMFPRQEYNVLALLLQALQTLAPEELKLHEVMTDSKAGRKIGWKGFFS
jgi:hypothetical protein